MSDANAKPVAGASEPDELEGLTLEQKVVLAFWKAKDATGRSAEGIRAVVETVRQEQEAEWQDIMLSGVEGWWLSHTAKETSNG